MLHLAYKNILQQTTSTGEFVFLEDTSSNGTFVNGEKVGKFSILISWEYSHYSTCNPL